MEIFERENPTAISGKFFSPTAICTNRVGCPAIADQYTILDQKQTIAVLFFNFGFCFWSRGRGRGGLCRYRLHFVSCLLIYSEGFPRPEGRKTKRLFVVRACGFPCRLGRRGSGNFERSSSTRFVRDELVKSWECDKFFSRFSKKRERGPPKVSWVCHKFELNCFKNGGRIYLSIMPRSELRTLSRSFTKKR